MKRRRAENLTGFLFALPALIIFTIFVVYPLLDIFYGSTLDWDGITKGTFIGLENYKELFTDKLFYRSLLNGFICAFVLTPVELGIGTVLALALLEKNIRGKSILRRSYFMPVVLSITVVCQLWIAMYDPSNGLFNKIFEALGIPYQQEWLSSMGISSLLAVIVVSAWQNVGYQFILIYAGAKSIPSHYYEAAQIDGATKFKTHLKVTIPMLAETYRMCLIFIFIGGLNMFGHMQIMTGGGPGTSTYTLPYMMYRESFKTGKYGYGSAIAVMIMLQCLLVVIFINRHVAREKITY